MARPSKAGLQQGEGSVIFWAALIGKEVVRPFRVPDGLKMNARSYTMHRRIHFEG